MQAATFAIELLPPSPDYLCATAVWVPSNCHFPVRKSGQAIAEEIDGTKCGFLPIENWAWFPLIKVKAKAELYYATCVLESNKVGAALFMFWKYD